MSVRILIVDDHEIVREGVRTLITRARPDWEVCGEASNGEEAIAGVKHLKPDVAVLDITMPVLSGLAAALRIAKLGLGTRVLIFTMHESDQLTDEVRQAGAQGYVLKSQGARDLIRAIDCLLAGGTFFGSPPESKAAEGHSFKPGSPAEAAPGALAFRSRGRMRKPAVRGSLKCFRMQDPTPLEPSSWTPRTCATRRLSHSG